MLRAPKSAKTRTKQQLSKSSQRKVTTKSTKRTSKQLTRGALRVSKRSAHTFPNGQYSVDLGTDPTIEQTPMFHSNVNPERPSEYWDYNSFVPAYGSDESYEITGKLANGKNSVILNGFAVNSNVPLAIKTMMPISQTKLMRQALALTNLKNLPHVQNLLDIVKDNDSRTISYVTTYSPHEPFEAIKNNLSTEDATLMTFQLIDGLDNIHSKGIIHRNIHPGNVLMNPRGDKKELCIVDFDNCEFFHPATAYATKRITKHGWSSPEMALSMQDYHYAIDVWGASMIAAQMFFPTEKFFQLQPGQTEIDMIAQIVGSEALATMIKKYELHGDIDPETVVPALEANYPKLDFKKLKSKNITPGMIEFFEATLVADHDERMLPFEATTLQVFAYLHDDYEESKNDPPPVDTQEIPYYKPVTVPTDGEEIEV